MSRHRRHRIGPLVRRSTYQSLWAQYNALLADHHALERDHQTVLEAHEELLYGLETPEPAPAGETPPGRAHVPSWAVTEPVPVITGLDPDKAFSLVKNTGLLDTASGEWSVAPGENG